MSRLQGRTVPAAETGSRWGSQCYPVPPGCSRGSGLFICCPSACARLPPSPGEQLLPPDLLLSGQGLVPQGSGEPCSSMAGQHPPVSGVQLHGVPVSEAPASGQALWSWHGARAWPSCPVASVTEAEVGGSCLSAPTMTVGAACTSHGFPHLPGSSWILLC